MTERRWSGFVHRHLSGRAASLIYSQSSTLQENHEYESYVQPLPTLAQPPEARNPFPSPAPRAGRITGLRCFSLLGPSCDTDFPMARWLKPLIPVWDFTPAFWRPFIQRVVDDFNANLPA